MVLECGLETKTMPILVSGMRVKRMDMGRMSGRMEIDTKGCGRTCLNMVRVLTYLLMEIPM